MLCVRGFAVCLADELGPSSTKKIIMLALPLQPSWASVVWKLGVNSGSLLYEGSLQMACEKKRNHSGHGPLPA